MRFLYGLICIAVFLSGCSNIQDSTVKVTNLMNNSGGSGTIVKSTSRETFVLTNAHVCGVVKTGGLVSTDSKLGFVTSYKVSEIHDLCLIKILGYLGPAISVASWIPRPYESSIVYGHPKLLPTIISKGNFSGKLVVQIVTGFRACTQQDMDNKDTSLFCIILGRVPNIRNYESLVTSATIQPGSSGSGVYGDDNKLKAVIFAGAGEFGYGLAVPFEYMYNFLNVEVNQLQELFPSPYMMLTGTEENNSNKNNIAKIKLICSKLLDNSVCAKFKETLKYNDLIER